MGLFEGLQNLFRGIAEGRSNDSGMFPGLPSIGLDETDGPFRFAAADDQMQVDMIWNLLSEQIGGLLHLKMHLGSGSLFGLDHHLSEMVFEFPSLFLQSFDFPVDLFDGFFHHRGVFHGQVV